MARKAHQPHAATSYLQGMDAFVRDQKMKSRIRVLIADDHPVVRYGLVHMLGTHDAIEVVGEAASGREVIEQLRKLRPDVTVLDLELGDSHGVEVLLALRETDPEARVIIYTAYEDSERIVEAVQAGVQGYLLKDAGDRELARAIEVVHEGGTLLQPAVATKLLRRMRKDSRADTSLPVPLTARELEVLQILAKGGSNGAIATSLHISEATVKFHVSAILSKFSVSNRTEAALAAIRLGIVKVASQRNL